MTPENTIKVMLDIENTRKLQAELPSKLQVILVSIVQFVIGCGILSWSIQLSNAVYPLLAHIILVLGVFIIIISAYTFFGYFYRKNHLLLLEALVSKNESSD